MITRRGAGIVAVAIAVFFLASTTRVGWVHLADAVLWGVVLLSFAVPWLSAPGLRIARTVDTSASTGSPGPLEGDDLPVTLSLSNSWWLPRFLVAVSYPVSAAGVTSTHRSIFFWSWPRRARNADTPVRLVRRGPHSLGSATVEITGPFGMFRRRRRVEMKHGVLAYPRWLPIQRLGLIEAMSGDLEGRRKSRTGTDASGTRAYVPGDPYRSIHWRNSARSGRLAVREFDTWNDRAVVFAIDTINVRGESPESSLDYAARISASCAKVIEREGGSVSVMTAAGESPEFLVWTGVMEHLARIQPGPAGTGSLADHISALQPGRRLMAFLTAGSEREATAVSAAAQRGVACVAIVFENTEIVAVNGTPESPERSGPVALGMHALWQAGVPVVRCAPGGLEDALAVIEGGKGAAGLSAQRGVSSRISAVTTGKSAGPKRMAA